MTLLTVHKIFIGAAIAMFLLCAGWEVSEYAGGNGWAAAYSVAAAGAALGLGIYLRWIGRRHASPEVRR